MHSNAPVALKIDFAYQIVQFVHIYDNDNKRFQETNLTLYASHIISCFPVLFYWIWTMCQNLRGFQTLCSSITCKRVYCGTFLVFVQPPVFNWDIYSVCSVWERLLTQIALLTDKLYQAQLLKNLIISLTFLQVHVWTTNQPFIEHVYFQGAYAARNH